MVGPTKDGMVPEEIVQTRPSWLYRFSKSPSPKDPETKRPSHQPFQLRERPEQVSRSGRKLKGRGIMKYRTPSPRREERRERERSRSPLYRRRGRRSRSRSHDQKTRRDRRRSRSRSNDRRRRRRSRSGGRREGRGDRSRNERREQRSRSTSQRRSKSPDQKPSNKKGNQVEVPVYDMRDSRSSTPLQDEEPFRVGVTTGRGKAHKNGGSNSNWYENVESDPNEELEEEYQKVEATLANQQFGVTS
ncbi:PREDICTED: probable ATP-dependent RNA helicase DDX46 [Amphimedon queenslandica]|uniref:Uncharacterized protein n=1 Tax=Amphimedon queenslandica TaxID=400682 RepID=A0AAN0JL71_AMPQE|nr:PREDICTED: probable ATP-dependent RNA helicase DDX46 [Amphimedon queenslandica]|eukprot:XP_019857470.1 PREDICTED: probable ATP-dependent RNA helicase DDX46 [Amphimedon queenslandica]